jgi:hypothetical protein
MLIRLFAVSWVICAHASSARCQGARDHESPIMRQCDFNDEVPLEKRIHIDAHVPPALGRAARKVISNLLDNDLKSFAACCSDKRVIVVSRDWDPERRPTGPGLLNLKQPPPHSVDGFGGTLNWFEQENNFGRSELAGSEFKSIFKQFHEYMVQNYAGFDVSTGMWDNWQVRFLGPVIEAKICAGSFMYFYFAKERRGWKVWRMEVASH